MSTHSEVISEQIRSVELEIEETNKSYSDASERYRDVKAEHDALQQKGNRLGHQLGVLAMQLQGLKGQLSAALEDEREIHSYVFETNQTLTVESQHLAATRISLKGISVMGGLNHSGPGGEVGSLIRVSAFNVGVVTSDDDTFHAIRRHVKHRGDLYILNQAATMLIGNRPGGSLTYTVVEGGRSYAESS